MQRDPADCDRPEVIARRCRATGVQAARRHLGDGPLADVPGYFARKWSSPVGSVHTMEPAPSAPRASPPARGGRGDGPRAAGAGTGRRHRAVRSARYATPTRAAGSHRPRNRATGMQAAPRHPGEVAARRKSVAHAHDYRTPSGDRLRADRRCGALRPPRMPIRTRALTAPDHGWRNWRPAGATDGCRAFRPRAHPIRAPAVAATDRGRRAPERAARQ
jgi:hypothetical protein